MKHQLTGEGGKGSGRRSEQVSRLVSDLRWELWQSTTTPKRKEVIKDELRKLTAET